MPHAEPMSLHERRATFAITSLFALRLLGLFMALPVLTPYAQGLTFATPTLIGIALGCYGLSQALFQIPFGLLSDRYDRRLIIGIGLLIFTLGSCIAGMADSIWGMILGRSLQGVGAVGSATIALLADHTRESQRTKAMALLGIIIGAAFVLALMLGPLLSRWVGVPGIFWTSAGLGVVCLCILWLLLPTSQQHIPINTDRSQVWGILQNRELQRLNLGIFILHAGLTATFAILPLILRDQAGIPPQQQWGFWLPTLLLGCLFMLPALRLSHLPQYAHRLYLGAIACLALTELGIGLIANSTVALATLMVGFFAAFNLLEALLPSTISKLAPAESRGTAMGIYSSAQFLGIFVGGATAGWLSGRHHPSAVFLFCAILLSFWVIIAKRPIPFQNSNP